MPMMVRVMTVAVMAVMMPPPMLAAYVGIRTQILVRIINRLPIIGTRSGIIRPLVGQVDARRGLGVKPVPGIDAIRTATAAVPRGIATAAGGGAANAEQSRPKGGSDEDSNSHTQHFHTPLPEAPESWREWRGWKSSLENFSKPLRSARILSNKINAPLSVFSDA
jgi:hypothetical protein